MARKDISTLWDRDMRTAIDENFKELYSEYTQAGLDAKEARNKALEAVSTSDLAKQLAEQANLTSDQVRNEMNNIIREQTSGGDVVPEVVSARGESATLGERLNSTDQQLAQTSTDLDSRGINVEAFGAIGDFDEITETGTNNYDAFVLASNYAKENNTQIYVPDKNFMLDGSLGVYDSLVGEGTLYFPNSNPNAGIKIVSKHTPIELDKTLISGLIEGSNTLTGLGADYTNHTLIIESDEPIMPRFNPPTNYPYYKKEVAIVTNSQGRIMPALDFNYDKSQIKSMRVIPQEKRLNIEVSIKGFGNVEKDGNLITCEERSNVNFNHISSSSLTGQAIQRHIQVNNCTLIEFNGVDISNAEYDGFGYGVQLGNSAFTMFLNCKITDCRHSLAGVNSKAVVISGGTYDKTIDSHWGSNYVISNVELNGSISFAGKDITIDGNKINLISNDLLWVRPDTPEITGKVLIVNNKIKSSSNHVNAYRVGGNTYPINDFFERKIGSPDSITIENNTFDVPASTYVALMLVDGMNNDFELPKRVNISKNVNINNNRFLMTLNINDFTTGNTEMKIEDQDLNGFDSSSTNFMMTDNRSDMSLPIFIVKIKDCENVATTIDGSLIKKLTYENSSVNLCYRSKVTPFNGDGVFLNNCICNNTLFNMPNGNIHFTSTVFSGAITINSVHIKLMNGCYTKAGTTGLPEIDLMSYLRAS